MLARIEAAVEASDALDVDLETGILTITCPDDTRIIVNRQTPNREIWVAARSGGFHFAARDGAWSDTRSGEELFASLARIVAPASGRQRRASRDAKRRARQKRRQNAAAGVGSRPDTNNSAVKILDKFVASRY